MFLDKHIVWNLTPSARNRLLVSYPGHKITQLLEINLNEKQVLKKNYFIMFNANHPQHFQNIECINFVWLVQSNSHQSSDYVDNSMFQMGHESSFYKMRKIQKTPQETFVNTLNMVAGMNVQHDCHHGECELTQISCVERRQSSTKSLELHWKAAHLQFLSPSPTFWINVMHGGLKNWCATIEKKVNKSQKKPPTTSAAIIDPSLLCL
ncbi:hypothetical protein VP01_2893g1 [Puccinia sorghi]|uniref:Uncharacterized protein n=1 Tax=Puccinia sorghi TaxID=27349 RepID=A0A0L6V1J7_9BASI|nr:hypothetical protein VP01_2893g1 [Puccinia sorghi]